VIIINQTNNDLGHSREKGYSDEEPDLVLYTTDSHGGEWLIDLIGTALWLVKLHQAEKNGSKKPANINIILLPIGNAKINPLTGFLIHVIKRLLIGLPDIIKNYLPWKFKQYAKQSLYNEIHSGKKVHLQQENITIIFSLFSTASLRYILLYLRSFGSSISLWLNHHERGDFNVQKFLNLHFQNIHIGDCIASTTLREQPQLAGSLQSCMQLFLNLTDAICICNLSNKLQKNKKNPTYVIVPEPTYLHFVYARALHYFRSTIIVEDFSYYSKFDITKPGVPYVNPWIAKPHPNLPDKNERSQIENYLKERIFETDRKLWYMFVGQNNNTLTEIKDIHGDKIDLDDKKLYAVVFLHSFEDGQYFYGLDGFNDLYHWVIFTIDRLLNNSSINMILIIQHPNVDYKTYPSDKLAFENLLERYCVNERIVFIDKISSLVHLAKSVRMFGITHHGSVAEELVYLHQPIIGSATAPWQNHYSFVRTWKNPEDYAILLDSLSIKSWAHPSEPELNSLYAYIQEYRFNEFQKKFPYQKTAGWMNFLRLYSREPSVEMNRENQKKFEEIFREIPADDPVFREFINSLVVLHDQLRSHCSNGLTIP
jgi:hypothetical protein